MSRAGQTEIRMRLLVEAPVPGVAHSLQDKKGGPVGAMVSQGGEPLSFDVPIRIGPGPKLYGEQVRSEGPARRFIYIAVGTQAGDCGSRWSRRMKIDIHAIPAPLLEGALAGRCLVGTLNGTGKDGTPACATIRVEGWRLD